MAPVVMNSKSATAKGTGFEKKNSASKSLKKKGVKQTDKYPMCPWKMTRYRNALHYHHCDECREKNYHNEKKAVETSGGGVRLSLYFCKKCAEANIYMGNIYKKTWKEDPQPVEEEDKEDEDGIKGEDVEEEE